MTMTTLKASVAVLALSASVAMAQQTLTTPEIPVDGTVPQADTAIVADVAPAPIVPVEDMTVAQLVGQNVYSPEGETVGEIDYVIVDGATPAAVIGIGGFLGLGEYTVALPLDAFDATEDGLIVAQSKDDLKAMPEIDETALASIDGSVAIAAVIANPDMYVDGGPDTAALDTSAPLAPADTDAEIAEAPEAAPMTDTGTEAEIAEAPEVAPMTDTGTEAEIAEAPEVAPMTDTGTEAEIAEAPEAATSLEDMTVGELVGLDVVGPEGEAVGEVDQVIATATGEIEVVVGVGGFLGLGEHNVSIPLDRLSLTADNTLAIDMTADELKELPEIDVSAIEALDAEIRLRDAS